MKNIFSIFILVCALKAQAGIIADTLYMEARGEGEHGQRAVATVIYNRAHGKAGKMEIVCLKPKQFSCWNGKTPKNVIIAPKNAFDRQAYIIALKIEKELLNGKFKPLGDWTHYFNPKLCNPSWAKGAKQTRVGNHNFLKTK